MMKVELIVVESDADHAEAMVMVERLMAAGGGPVLRAQARLIEDYERRRWPADLPTAADVLHYIMDQRSLARTDMAAVLGGTNKFDDIMNGRSGFSPAMIRRLHARFDIPVDVLFSAPRHAAA